MFLAALRVLPIKDLKDLRAFFSRGYYRHAGPKEPEEVFSHERSRGTGPRATVDEAVSLYRRAWALACHTRMRAGFPRHANHLKQDFQDFQDFTGLGL